MSTTTLRAALRSIAKDIWPWMARIGLTTAGDLSIKSSTSKVELAGGDAAVGRVGDGVTRLAFYPGTPGTTPPVLYYSSSATPPYAWSIVTAPVGLGLPPTPLEPGTRLEIITGSAKVRAG